MSALGALGFMALGAALGAACRWVAARVMRARPRCAWCGAWTVSLQGQACPRCLHEVAQEGRAAPDGWPEA